MKQCFVCKHDCPCECFEINTDYGCIYFCSINCYNKSNKDCGWDADFGQFNKHYHNCKLGGMFKEKWKEAIKQEELYRKLYFEFHAKWKALAYPKKEGEKRT